MRSIVVLTYVVVLLAPLSVVSGFEGSTGVTNRSDATGEALFSSEVNLLQLKGVGESNTPEAPLAASSSTTWQWAFGPESCYDWFVAPCTVTWPQPQCPANPQGQPCSPLGAECYRVISSKSFHYYICH